MLIFGNKTMIKGQKLFNHQVKIFISRVTEVQGKSVTVRKSTGCDNEAVLLDHRSPSPLLNGTPLVVDGLSSFYQL